MIDLIKLKEELNCAKARVFIAKTREDLYTLKAREASTFYKLCLDEQDRLEVELAYAMRDAEQKSEPKGAWAWIVSQL